MIFKTFRQQTRHSIKSSIGTLEIPDAYRNYFREIVDSIEGWLSLEESYLLSEVASMTSQETVIVEIGSYKGRSTASLAYKTLSDIISVDPHTGDRSQVDAGLLIDTELEFLRNMELLGFEDRIMSVRAKSVDASKNYDGRPIELLFIDGWHSTSAVIEDITSWASYLHTESTVIFDDWSDPEVWAGINSSRHLLPPILGNIGKDLVFSSSKNLLSSNLGRYLNRRWKLRLLFSVRALIKQFLAKRAVG